MKIPDVCAGWKMETFLDVGQGSLQWYRGHRFNTPPAYDQKGHEDDCFVYLTFI